MKQDQLKQKAKLTKGLLIVALLFSLFAFLGDVGYCPSKLESTPGTELFVAARQEFGQPESAPEQPERFIRKRFFAYESYSIAALLVSNKLISHQISRFCNVLPLAILISKFFRSKTIPANSETPHANGYCFPANPLS